MMTTSKEAAAKFDKRDFRSVMGLFATGVSVVTTQLNGETHAMTANALTSVSLEPMLVLVCVQKNAHMAQFLRESGEFAINIFGGNACCIEFGLCEDTNGKEDFAGGRRRDANVAYINKPCTVAATGTCGVVFATGWLENRDKFYIGRQMVQKLDPCC